MLTWLGVVACQLGEGLSVMEIDLRFSYSSDLLAPPFRLDGLSFSRGVNHLTYILTAAFLGCRRLSFGCWLSSGAWRVDRVDTT